MTTHHIILWKLKDEYSDVLPSSNVDLMLDSTFDSPEPLNGYSVHPEHIAIADKRVRPYIEGRYCMDFEQVFNK